MSDLKLNIVLYTRLQDGPMSIANMYIYISYITDDLNNARFAAYRTAMKLRLVQKKLCRKFLVYYIQSGCFLSGYFSSLYFGVLCLIKIFKNNPLARNIV